MTLQHRPSAVDAPRPDAGRDILLEGFCKSAALAAVEIQHRRILLHPGQRRADHVLRDAGGGSFRRVDTLKGCNAAVRGDLLRRIGFEQSLRGAGAQVHWEIALCLDVAAAGFGVAYDPEIRVIHHIAPRYDIDQGHRGVFSPEGLYDMVWNEHFVVSNRMSPAKSFRHFLYSVLVGSYSAPGAVQYLRLLLHRDPRRNERFMIARKAIRDGRRAGSHARA